MRTPRLTLAAALLACVACHDSPSELDGPSGTPQSVVLAAQSAVDVGGTWLVTALEQLTFPEWVATLLGIPADGPTTIARCTTSGSMALTQVGTSLTGTVIFNAQECTTRGGETFQSPGIFAPIDIAAGEVRGRHLQLQLDGLVIDCTWHAVASGSASAGVSTLNGGGHCIVPGHPKSEVPGFNPPPGGTSTTLSLTAVRL